MKLLILGGAGMLGHQLVKSLSVKHDVQWTTRGDFDPLNPYALRRMIEVFKPKVVINCIGVVKQRTVEPEEMIDINSVYPHKLARLCREQFVRLIHFSTDCVFSGDRGSYDENFTPDAYDLYGRSKLLGEVSDVGCITLRTSIIGRELKTCQGIVEWFLSQHGEVPGYTHHLFNGLTTIEMARVVQTVLRCPDAHGVWHVGGYLTSKYDLLHDLRKHYRNPVHLLRDSTSRCNRTLNPSRFMKYFGYEPPSWKQMIGELT